MVSRKSWLAYQAQFNMAVIRMQERKKFKEVLESLGFKEECAY